MSKRSLASFGELANVNKNNIDNDNKNDNNHDNIMEIINKPKSVKTMVGIYFDPDVAAALRRVSCRRKGAQSQLVNEVMRRFFRDQGLL